MSGTPVSWTEAAPIGRPMPERDAAAVPALMSIGTTQKPMPHGFRKRLGRPTDCQRKVNGSTPPEAAPVHPILGAGQWRRTAQIVRAAPMNRTTPPCRLDHSNQMRLIFMTWPATPQSGSRIAGPRAIEERPLMDPLRSNRVVPSGCFGAARLTMTRNICAQPHGLDMISMFAIRRMDFESFARRTATRTVIGVSGRQVQTALAQAPLTCDSDQN